MPDNPSVSCCNAADCYPTKIKYVNGDIYAKQRGITVLVLLSVVLTVAYFTASKRGIRHLRPRYPARSLGSRPRKNRQSFNLLVGHCQFRKKIDDGGFETPYRLRKQVVEPVFGQIKQARGFRQFLLRGVEKVRAEWAMICTAHNLLKLFTLANAA